MASTLPPPPATTTSSSATYLLPIPQRLPIIPAPARLFARTSGQRTINFHTMAKYSVPGQNLTFDIPDEGEVFKVGSEVYVRKGTQLRGVNVESLGEKLFDPAKAPADAKARAGGGQVTYSHLSPGQKRELGLQALQNAGVDYSAIGERTESNFADITAVFDRFLGGRSALDDLSLLKSASQGKGEVITQTVDPDNPQGPAIKSSTGEILRDTPAIETNLSKTGATPGQVGILAAAQKGGAPVSAEAAAAAGVIPKPVDTTSKPATDADKAILKLPAAGRILTDAEIAAIRRQQAAAPAAAPVTPSAVDATVERAKAMVEQTKAEVDNPFAGAPFDPP